MRMRRGQILRTSDLSLLAELRRAGLTVTAEGGRLRVGPSHLLADELRAAIREHRAGLVRILAAEAAPDVESYPSPTPAEKVPPRANMAPSRVSCGACLHFIPGQPLPGESLGRCTVTMTCLPPAGGSGHGAPYPMAPRTCPSYEGIES